MEEKKAKEFKMRGNKEQKLSYDQLNAACGQLYQQNQRLVQELRQANLTNMFKRLDYLFMVLNYSTIIKDSDFVNSCIDEIKDALTIRKEDKEEGKNTEESKEG